MQKDVKFGVAVAYYGPLHPSHAQSIRDFSREGIPVSEIHGSPYPEVARAEMTRQLLEAESNGMECIVMVDHNVCTSPYEVARLAKYATERECVISAVHNHKPRGFRPQFRNGLGFCAIPLKVIKKLAEQDDRYYTNSAVLDTGFSKGARPFFSPFTKGGKPLVEGIYCTEDTAFFQRVKNAGLIVIQKNANHEFLGYPKYSERFANIPPNQQSDYRRKGGPKYAICVPSFGNRIREQVKGLWELEKYGVPIIEVFNCPYIDVARSRLVQLALDTFELDGVFFLDHDIVFAPEDIIKLICYSHDTQSMVAAAYCMRKAGHNVIGALDRKWGDKVRWFKGGGIEKALYTGLGFAAIPRAIFDRLDSTLPDLNAGFDKPLKPYFSLDVTGNFYCGEDVSFCNRVHGLHVEQIGKEDWKVERNGSGVGFSIVIDTRIRIFHKGEYDYSLEDSGIIVPRYETLETNLFETKEEKLKFIIDANEDKKSQSEMMNLVNQ